MEYGGFWRRVGAFLTDQLILSLCMVIPGLLAFETAMTLSAPGIWLIYQEIIFLVMLAIRWPYNVFLVCRYGSTAGMSLFKLKLCMQDGSAMSGRAAGRRYSVAAVLYLLAALPNVWNVFLIFLPATPWDETLFFSSTDTWTAWLSFLIVYWSLSEFFVLLLNQQRRGLQDYMAGTVVIKRSAKDASKAAHNRAAQDIFPEME